jgi:periplasmic protein TonB
MEEKKHPSLDLRKKSGLFFNIGLTLSLGLVIVAFEWETEFELTEIEPEEIVMASLLTDNIIATSHPVPAKPKPMSPPTDNIKEVADDAIEEILKKEEFSFDPEDFTFNGVIEDGPTTIEIPDEIFDIVESQPEPIGGMNSFLKDIASQINYPSKARRTGIEGVVFVQFVIDVDGKIIDVKTVKGIGGGCDEEAVRVIEKAPAWLPGKQRGMPVKVRKIIPIRFILPK